ncbi:SDR family NAD(P)-dependent oxidoreductase [Actinokineospora diospyrosa]|uniref:NAD(P)-dependent dehydrogenase, short-chain alcohol dehydrogenase family n=1 Tax=Actinokineospora diospyrosa TaxID=103728 RepID=A0ABT1IAM7_9PSEU|nr:SDR family oxidoreductase [Actinokineospora diospyrosa]MCP2269698.1 NAD(P)-dependent dehydrogenase, short-chain alcohol dehydrogenase family [Actinokineospora diospyrosa]
MNTGNESAAEVTRPPRRVLVTGASGGIGAAVARSFAAQGDRIAVHYSSRVNRAERLVAELPGDGHLVVGADLTDPAAVPPLVAATVEGLGGVDVLVNNAALLTPAHPPVTTSYADWTRAWRDVLAVNLIGAANLTHQVAVRMIEQGGGGRIVNVGSRGAFRGEPEHPAYGASKAGLHALGQSLAIALAPHGISVTSVAPGFVNTERVSGRLEGSAGDAIRAQSPFDRVATPEEIAAAVVYLASPEALWASGTILDLNGASYLRT